MRWVRDIWNEMDPQVHLNYWMHTGIIDHIVNLCEAAREISTSALEQERLELSSLMAELVPRRQHIRTTVEVTDEYLVQNIVNIINPSLVGEAREKTRPMTTRSHFRHLKSSFVILHTHRAFWTVTTNAPLKFVAYWLLRCERFRGDTRSRSDRLIALICLRSFVLVICTVSQ